MSEPAQNGEASDIVELPLAADTPEEPSTRGSAIEKKATARANIGSIIDFDFVDHFSLKQPSATIRFRDKNVRVYELANDQLQLEHKVIHSTEEDNDSHSCTNPEANDNQKKTKLEITMKRLRGGSFGLRLLRTLYTLAAILMFGFLFVFAAQIVVYQILEIPRHGGDASGQDLDVYVMISSLFSIPVVVYSMSSLLVFGMAYVGDTWNGHVLFAHFVAGDGSRGVRRVSVEWFCFVMYIAIPVLVSVVAFFASIENAVNVGLIAWYICMNLAFFLFCTMAILVTLTQRYAGIQEQAYVVDSGVFDPKKSKKESTYAYMGLYSRTTVLSWNPFFDRLDPPLRRFSIEDIRETVPFVTNKTWSLEKICCRLRNGRSRLAISGPNALEPMQYKSTLGCTICGIVLLVLFVSGFLYNTGQSLVIQILS